MMVAIGGEGIGGRWVKEMGIGRRRMGAVVVCLENRREKAGISTAGKSVYKNRSFLAPSRRNSVNVSDIYCIYLHFH